jgi:hypothetical protein
MATCYYCGEEIEFFHDGSARFPFTHLVLAAVAVAAIPVAGMAVSLRFVRQKTASSSNSRSLPIRATSIRTLAVRSAVRASISTSRRMAAESFSMSLGRRGRNTHALTTPSFAITFRLLRMRTENRLQACLARRRGIRLDIAMRNMASECWVWAA